MTAASTGGTGVWELRRLERQLLAGCLLLVALGFLMILGSGQAAGRRLGLLDLLPLLTYAASLLVIHLTLVLFRFRGDQMLPVVAAFLSGLGLLAQYRMRLRGCAGAYRSLGILPHGTIRTFEFPPHPGPLPEGEGVKCADCAVWQYRCGS